MLAGKKAEWLPMMIKREQIASSDSPGHIWESTGDRRQGVDTSQVEPDGERRTKRNCSKNIEGGS